MPEKRKPAEWLIRLGFFHGRGLSSPAIATKLGDGTGPATVRKMLQRADLDEIMARRVVVPVEMSWQERNSLQENAEKHRLTINEYARRLLYDSGITCDLYVGITDGRYGDES